MGSACKDKIGNLDPAPGSKAPGGKMAVLKGFQPPLVKFPV